MVENAEKFRKRYLLKYIIQKLQEMEENVRKVYENLR